MYSTYTTTITYTTYRFNTTNYTIYCSTSIYMYVFDHFICICKLTLILFVALMLLYYIVDEDSFLTRNGMSWLL